MTKTATEQKTTSSVWAKAEETIVDLYRLNIDEDFQVRNKLNQAAIKRYVGVLKSGQEMPPIKIGIIDKQPTLLDGWHRVEAMRSLGWTEAQALKIETTEAEAKWLAAQANLEHGVPLLGRDEIKKVFMAFIETNQHRDQNGKLRTYRDIAQAIGKSVGTIHKWMKVMFPELAIEFAKNAPEKERFHGKGGCEPFEEAAAVRDWVKEQMGGVVLEFHACKTDAAKEAIHDAVEAALAGFRNDEHWQRTPF